MTPHHTAVVYTTQIHVMVRDPRRIVAITTNTTTPISYHQELEEAVVEADIDGRALSTMRKGDLRSLARKACLDKASRRSLYAAVEDLKDGIGADGERVLCLPSSVIHLTGPTRFPYRRRFPPPYHSEFET